MFLHLLLDQLKKLGQPKVSLSFFQANTNQINDVRAEISVIKGMLVNISKQLPPNLPPQPPRTSAATTAGPAPGPSSRGIKAAVAAARDNVSLSLKLRTYNLFILETGRYEL